MSLKTFIEAIKNLDTKTCVFDCWIDPEKKSFCPLGSLAVKNGFKVDWSRFETDEYGVESDIGWGMRSFLEKKFKITSDDIMTFTDTYDRVRNQKKGTIFAKEKAIVSLEKRLQNKKTLRDN